MKHDFTDHEKEVGFVEVILLLSQAQSVEDHLGLYGFCLSPPVEFEDGRFQRIVTFDQEE